MGIDKATRKRLSYNLQAQLKNKITFFTLPIISCSKSFSNNLSFYDKVHL